MSDPGPTYEELAERVARLEAQVLELQRRSAPAPAPGPRPQAPRPAAPRVILTPPAKPAPQFSPVVLVASVGAVILLVGVLFFLHWSIQQGWIGPEVRFLLGLGAGAGLAAGAAKLVLGGRPRLGTALLLAGLGTLTFSLRFGAFAYHFFPAALGFAGTFAAVLFGGALGARSRHGGPLAVALATGFAAPLVFSEQPHREVQLALYLTVLQGGALLVPYLARTGARWGVSRWMAVSLTWLYLWAACEGVLPERAVTLGILLLGHLGLSFTWIWLPGGPAEEKPSTPTALWIPTVMGFTGLGWLLWTRKLHLMPEAYALPILAVAALNLALVQPLRQRMNGRQADLGLLALAFGHLALAVPVALAWRWVGPVWGVFALGLAWAATRMENEEEGPSLLRLAWGFAILATLRWFIHSADLGLFSASPRVPFLNTHFAGGALAAGAWALLCRSTGVARALAFAALQVVGGFTLSMELGALVRWSGGSPRLGQVVVTLVWALLGALQWLRGLSAEKAFMIAGYSWLGLAAIKLLTTDLAHADTPKRALAFLGVGVILLAAALLGNKLRRTPEEEA